MTKPRPTTTADLFDRMIQRIERLERRGKDTGGLTKIAPSAPTPGSVISDNGDVIFVNTSIAGGDGLFYEGRAQRYRVVIDVSGTSAASSLFGNFRAGGASNATANYTYSRNYNGAGSTPTSVGNAGLTRFELAGVSSPAASDGSHVAILDIFDPGSATERARWLAQCTSTGSPAFAIVVQSGGFFQSVAAFDGIQFSPASGTFSGRMSVYAYS